MPKIIENLRETLLAETRRVLLESGYAGVNIRTIAHSCGAAAGTVYNYFPSKDLLVANVLLDDWLECMAHARSQSKRCTCQQQSVQVLYGQLLAFNQRYAALFRESAMPLAGPAYQQRHVQLRGQVADVLQELLCRFGRAPSPITLTLFSECLLTAATEQWTFEDFYPALEKLTEQEN